MSKEASSSAPPQDAASLSAATVDSIIDASAQYLEVDSSKVKIPAYLKSDVSAIIAAFPDNTGADPTIAPTVGKPFMFGGSKIMITQENVMNVQQALLDMYFLGVENLDKALLMTAYQGFDPVLFYPAFAAFCGKLGVGPSKVALMIISAFVMRGTNINKMKGKSTAEFKALLTTWTGAGLVQASTDAKAITVGRVAALYPQYTCWVNCYALQHGIKAELVPGTSLPVFMRFTGAPSIVPDAIWNTYRDQYMNYMKEFTKIITKDAKTGKALEDSEIDRRMNTVIAIAAAQRKAGSFHVQKQEKYALFLQNKMVINLEWGFILAPQNMAPVYQVAAPSPNQLPGGTNPSKGLK